FITNHDTFLQTIKSDSENFKPFGEKISEYRLNDDDRATFSTPRFKEFHRRLQIFVLFYIEAGSYIDEEDDKWEIALIFEKKTVGDSKVYSIVGYCTMYLYYFLTSAGNSNENHTNANANNKLPLHMSINQGGQIRDNIRVRISQFLILPHYQREGHGNKFYQALYQSFLADPRIKDITVEDPSDKFQEIRDKNDIRFLRENKALEGLKAPVDRNVFNELQKKYKLNKRQMARCIEIELLRNLNKTDPVAYKAYRLQVKQRLYLWNEDILRQLDRAERIQKLEETFKGLEEDYHSIILQL
ncbi:1734_t:CDS:2, partial [Racocetra persica]